MMALVLMVDLLVAMRLLQMLHLLLEIRAQLSMVLPFNRRKLSFVLIMLLKSLHYFKISTSHCKQTRMLVELWVVASLMMALERLKTNARKKLNLSAQLSS
jgi:hypothetical protein